MNAKLQTAIDNFVAAHSALAGGSVGMAKFYVERFMEEGLVETLEREIRTGSNSLSANRLAEVEVLKVFLAEVQAALVEDESISEEISAPAPIVIESDSKEQSYNEYANFMARQEQPYMSEKQWNEAKAEAERKAKAKQKDIVQSSILMTTNTMHNAATFTFENSALQREIIVSQNEDNGKWEIIQFEDKIPSDWDVPDGFEYESRYESLEMALMKAQELINI